MTKPSDACCFVETHENADGHIKEPCEASVADEQAAWLVHPKPGTGSQIDDASVNVGRLVRQRLSQSCNVASISSD